jgi:hypothetical protein
MVGGKMPMLIFILASGYLFTVYILLAIAKRSSKRTINPRHQLSVSKSQSDVSVAEQVNEVINTSESIDFGF